MNRTKKMALGMGTALVLAACYAGAPANGASAVARVDSVRIAIENQNFNDATVYAEYEGYNVDRLGVVSGFQRDTFTLAWKDRRLRMQTRLQAAGVTVSNDLAVAPGDLVELVIQPQAHLRRDQ